MQGLFLYLKNNSEENSTGTTTQTTLIRHDMHFKTTINHRIFGGKKGISINKDIGIALILTKRIIFKNNAHLNNYFN